MAGFAARVADAGHSLAAAASAAVRGGWLTARRGAFGTAVGARAVVARDHGAGATLGVGLARLLLQLPADALILLLARLLSALQTLLGFEATARRLDDDEHTLLRRVFGGGIDARAVRLKVGRLGLLGVPRRAFVVGDVVHVPLPQYAAAARSRTRNNESLAHRAPALLVHELTHVWQHQLHGTRYLSECLLAQWLGDGYNVAVALEAGRGWDDLNFEQQAELLQCAYAAGWFDEPRFDEAGAAGDGRRLLLRLVDARRDDGFAVELVPAAAADEPPPDWRDATPLLRQGLAAVRAHRER
ncbi:MAG TPA: hypothetical protein VFS60_05540 [Thermoanaerobaculia bacterium]|nr:hypothetical protein [Thermoanaerobaculia bacterium]